MKIIKLTSLGIMVALSLGMYESHAQIDQATEEKTPRPGTSQSKSKPTPSPVGMPEDIPADLRIVFSNAPHISIKQKISALVRHSRKTKFEVVEDALRWLIHQPDHSEKLRDEATKVLIRWRTNWLVADLQAMCNDTGHTLTWRQRCLENLGVLHSISLDSDAYTAVVESTNSSQPELRNTALRTLSQLCHKWNWGISNPEKLQTLHDTVKRSLNSKLISERIQALKAIEIAGLTTESATLKRLALDLNQPVAIREATLYAIGRVLPPYALSILEASFSSTDDRILKAAHTIQPYVLAAQLDHADVEIRKRAFKELLNLGPDSYHALQGLLNYDGTVKKRLAKEILSATMLKNMALPLLDRSKMNIFGADEKNEIEGIKGILVNHEEQKIAIEGEFLIEFGTLECAVVCKDSEQLHESVLVLQCTPLDICYALLASNYTFAEELRSNGKIHLPQKAGVMLSVEYEREVQSPTGRHTENVRLPLEGFIWNTSLGQSMKRVPWAFTGSTIRTLSTGKKVMLAMIEQCVVSIIPDPNALLNTPLDSAELSDLDPDQGAYYEINRALVPKRGTKCWLVFEPWSGEQSKDGFFSDTKKKK